MTETKAADYVRIERDFAATPETVWNLWTRPDHFSAWYGPDGSTIAQATMDVRVGGIRTLCMEFATPLGPKQMWFTGTYLELVENELLVYTDSMADEHGTILTPAQLGMPADHPTTTVVRVELEPTPTGTRMTLTHSGIPAGSPGAIGWAMALDKLDAHLSA